MAVPAAGQPVNTSQPDHVIGSGTPASCTGQAVVDAVALGGKIRFNCGPNPVTITLPSTAKVFNNRPDVTLDGGGLVTLSGGDRVRILYQNTCDPAQVWTTSHCNNQETPRLTVQNIGFTQGNSTGQLTDGGGGGAIFVRGGQFKIVNSVFTRNRCETTGPDMGGGAVRVLSIYQNRPVYVVGRGRLGRFCSRRDWLWHGLRSGLCCWLRCGFCRGFCWLGWLLRRAPLLLVAAQHGGLAGHRRVWRLLRAARWNVGRWQRFWLARWLCSHRHGLHHFFCAGWGASGCGGLRAARCGPRHWRQRLVCTARHGALLEGSARIVCWNGIHGARGRAGGASVLRAWRRG